MTEQHAQQPENDASGQRQSPTGKTAQTATRTEPSLSTRTVGIVAGAICVIGVVLILFAIFR